MQHLSSLLCNAHFRGFRKTAVRGRAAKTRYHASESQETRYFQGFARFRHVPVWYRMKIRRVTRFLYVFANMPSRTVPQAALRRRYGKPGTRTRQAYPAGKRVTRPARPERYAWHPGSSSYRPVRRCRGTRAGKKSEQEKVQEKPLPA